MIDIHINIGSNSGHREALIERAVAAVRSAFPDADIRCSDVIETPPWGFDSPNPFLNVGVMISLRSYSSSSAMEHLTVRTHFNASASADCVPASFERLSAPADCIPVPADSVSVSDISVDGADAFQCVRTDKLTGFALEILRKLQEIQSNIDPSPHRDASGAYIDRAIDIDLITIDDWVVDHPDLTLPHPRMHMRDFVLIPLRQLAPHWTHPILAKTAVEMIADLK